MRRSVMHGLFFAAAAAGVSMGALAGDDTWRFCGNDLLISGTYGIQIQGTQLYAPSGVTESVVGVIIRQYDGQGGFTQTSNVKGSISGIVPDRFGAGTYQVRGDCSLIVDFSPAPGVLLREQAVIVDNGNEIRSISVLPATSMVTGVQLRMRSSSQ
jgi:hypothetical protein